MLLTALLAINGFLALSFGVSTFIFTRKNNKIKSKIESERNHFKFYSEAFFILNEMLKSNSKIDKEIDWTENNNQQLSNDLLEKVSQEQFDIMDEKIQKAKSKLESKQTENEQLYKKAYPILQKIEQEKRRKKEKQEEIERKKRKKRQEEEDRYRSSLYSSSYSSSSSSSYDSSSSSSNWSGGGGDSSGGGGSSDW